MTIENELKELTIKKSKSIIATIQSMLNNCIENDGVKKSMSIYEFLGIEADAIANGYIKEKQTNLSDITYNKLNHLKKFLTLEANAKELVDFILKREFEHAQRVAIIANEQTHEDIKIEPSKKMPAYLALSCDIAGQYVLNDILPNLIEVDTNSPADFVIEGNENSKQPTYFNGDALFVIKRRPIAC